MRAVRSPAVDPVGLTEPVRVGACPLKWKKPCRAAEAPLTGGEGGLIVTGV